VRAAFYSFLGYFLTPAGIVVIGMLDASLAFYLPLGVDFVTIVMTARHPDLFWLYAGLATAGSLMGGTSTYWIGKQIGEKGLSRFVRERQLQRVKARVDRGALVVASLGMIPPPFPFTPFVLGAGALDVSPLPFFGALALARVARFGLEAAFAAYYGSGILRWTKTPMFEAFVAGLIVLVVVGTVVSAVLVWRSAKGREPTARAPERRE
jgi:membrane protein YqaA with SNARE-associated domain